MTRKPYVTVVEAIGDLPSLSAGEDSDLANHVAANHQSATVADCEKLDYGQSRYDYGESWRRLHPDEPAPTIKENHGAPFVHPSQPRVGTPRECARLQSFPDWFTFHGSKSRTLVQIGNAVPVNLAESVVGVLPV